MESPFTVRKKPGELKNEGISSIRRQEGCLAMTAAFNDTADSAP